MKKKIEKVLIMILGNAVLALGTAAFVVPNGLISGGVTGIGLILEHFLACRLMSVFLSGMLSCFCWAQR